MRNKILIVEQDPLVRAKLEQTFQEVIDEGGELFLTFNTKDGLALLRQQKPQLVFLNLYLIGESLKDWETPFSHLVLICDKGDAVPPHVDLLVKPLKTNQILEKRYHLEKKAYPPFSPM